MGWDVCVWGGGGAVILGCRDENHTLLVLKEETIVELQCGNKMKWPGI